MNPFEFEPKTVLKPWGEYEVVWSHLHAVRDEVMIKMLRVNPEQSLSLQSHVFRDEHWFVARGEARVTYQTEYEIGSESVRMGVLKKGESIDIPRGSRHRLANPCQSEILVVVEVLTGSPIIEDDIRRYEDIYGRVLWQL